MNQSSQDLVVTGFGAVTAQAVGLDAHSQLLKDGATKTTTSEYSMAAFKPAPHITDKRMLKAVSPVDAIGLVAIEGLAKDMNYKPGLYPAERVGLYVGAPPATSFDNEGYVEAMNQAKDRDGRCSAKDFGKTCMSSRPTTLLLGLPNNVLCYGSMILDAKGPNSNYTSLAMSGHLAVQNAARRLKRGNIDLAVAGGFSAHTEAVNSSLFQKLGVYSLDGETGARLADGAAFMALERRGAAAARGAKIRATYVAGAVASDGMGPLMMDINGEAYESAIRRALASASIAASDIGLVLASGTGATRVATSEYSVLSRVFAKEREFPALGSFFPVLGHLMEASGLLELGLLSWLYELGEIPAALRTTDRVEPTSRINSERPYALILKASPWGEYSCIVARKE